MPSTAARALWALCLAFAAAAQDTRPVNRLANETSPYLLQHRHNPVDWYPWGPEALARSKKEDKPIFLSIGYSACHWCHVMEHESFSNPQTSKLMNERFVCIKVDREERPDLDEIYMAAVQRMTGHGGWPMSVFLTPDLKPFFGGTYWPPETRQGMPGFPRVLEHIDTIWKTRREDALNAAEDVAQELGAALKPEQQPGEPTSKMTEAAAADSLRRFDPEEGGFGHPPRHAPKFPHCSELMVLLRHAARTGDAQSRRVVEVTLSKMARGGIYDQIGGGFHRYSVDREWVVPHFEKMLYDNAQLARVYAEAFQLWADPEHKRIACETLDYLLAEMQDESGGIWSTTDADSEGEEGKFFVWSRDEVDKLLGDDARLAAERWGITAAGNFEGKNVLTLAKSFDEIAAATKVDKATVEKKIAAARETLYSKRKTRVAPGTDDKILAAWNGLALSAFAYGHQVFGDERYLAAARRIGEFLWTKMRADGRLLRTWRQGKRGVRGYLEDYAFVADGMLSLFESDFDPKWLQRALELLGTIRKDFRDSDGGLWFTAADHETLIARSKSVMESSTPSGAAVAALAFLRAGLLTGDLGLYDVGLGVLKGNHDMLEKAPSGCPALLVAVEFALSDPKEVVVAGEPGDPGTRALVAKARAAFPPHRVVALVHDGNRAALEKVSEVVKGKGPAGGKAAAYVCKRGVCEAPVTEAEGLAQRLR
jgi:hypothetical protein